MNVLFFLTPKCECTCLRTDDSLRQALEKMEKTRYAAVPLLDKDGSYAGTVTEGDVLWFIKNEKQFDMRIAEKLKVSDISRKRDYSALSVTADMSEVFRLAMNQNFVPIQDDDGTFIGIVTRTSVMKYLQKQFGTPVAGDALFKGVLESGVLR